ncbi:hypothetical protein RIR_jg16552.t1 [Rhizophagus irregularis DAOM 181602=DAOM 197198]|nr:hypothetical protein RIR_jg16552.t1 [Rhizophagus irregularis DAOM 181602=DAOM 197198]
MLNNRIKNNNNNNKVNLENIDNLNALYLTLHIGTHNINGLIGNSTKLYRILNWMQENQVDIMALNETNLDQRNSFFKTPDSFKEQFYIYWSSKQYDKNKDQEWR